MQGRGQGGRIFRRHGQAATGVGHDIVAAFDRLHYRAGRQHVVEQLVGADAELEQRAAPQADIGRVDVGHHGLHGGARHRIGEGDVAQAELAGQALELRFVGAIAQQQEADGLVAQPRHRLQQHVQRIGVAVRAGVGKHEIALFAQLADLRAYPQIVGVIEVGRTVFRHRHAVGHVRIPPRVQPALAHVGQGAWQHGNGQVGVPVRVVFRVLHRRDHRMPGLEAAQQPGRQRPQVVHFEHQAGAGLAGQACRGQDVVGMRGRGNDDIRPPAAKVAAQPIQARAELQHIEQAARAVALVRQRGIPEILDAIDVLARQPAACLGGARPDVRDRAGRHFYLMPMPDPFAAEVIRPELHAIAGRACVMVDQQDVHGGACTTVDQWAARASTMRRAAWPSP
ncbi:Uncharacterised protein [Bordetella pertussis]|nr:Uncharacterised protein [Bordetella pertussis]CPO32535.1 Uncharacterised protein [Bordetella pertussis]CPO60619.1 Uncharacterised protein [Bordetella pertussis]CRE20537.1 Uncharacterised protein [Bordetella pertussis]